jgi:2-oxoglutarate/2-oxoacid ferredoxin oxidoreductase subunit alpha
LAIDFNFMVGGEAGQGVQSIGLILSKTFSRGGYHVFTDQDYESRIRGGNSFCRVRIREREVLALSEKVDILLALNPETIERHKQELSPGGVVVIIVKKLPGKVI